MRIQVCSGVGTGPTELSAFDQALVKAGVANYNLLYLSSVLPPRSKVKIVKKGDVKLTGKWGDRLYIVVSQLRTSQRNQEVWAGIGWVQDPKTKKGLLVEHEAHSKAEVKADIKCSLAALVKNRDIKFGPVRMHIVGVKCVAEPVCALVVAVFESSTWRTLLQKEVKLNPLRLTAMRRHG